MAVTGRVTDHGMRAEPTWFGPESAPLFGVVTTPDGGAKAVAVICPPLGKEQIDTYHGVKLLAQELAARGIASVRFDYLGTGDSSGIEGSPRAIEEYLDSITAAIEFARSLGPAQVMLVGLRAGALLAGRAAHQLGPLTGLILWDPVLRGKRYLREQHSLYQITAGADTADFGTDPILGGVLHPEASTALRGLLLSSSVTTAAEATLVAVRAPRRADVAQFEEYGATILELTDHERFVEPASFVVEVPAADITAIADWADSHLGDGLPTRVQFARRRTATVARDADGAPIEETLESAGPHRLFTIRTSRRGVSPEAAPVAIYQATATETRIGMGRVWVLSARELAAGGVVAYRFDRRGVGETGYASSEFATIYSPESDEDALAIFDHTGAAADQVVLTGVCSGSWNSAFVARERGARAVVLVNNIHWATKVKPIEGDALDALNLNNLGDRPTQSTPVRMWVKKQLHDRLPYVGWLAIGKAGVTQVPETLLRALARKGVAVTAVLSPDDHQWFLNQRGAEGMTRLARRGVTPTITVCDSGEHALLQRTIQRFTRHHIQHTFSNEYGLKFQHEYSSDDRDRGSGRAAAFVSTRGGSHDHQ